MIKKALFMPFAVATWMAMEARKGGHTAAKESKRARLLFWRGLRLLADKKISDLETGKVPQTEEQDSGASSRLTSIEIE